VFCACLFVNLQPFGFCKGMVADSEDESMPSSPVTSSTTNYDMPGNALDFFFLISSVCTVLQSLL
jgi:hypothetical protein